MYIKYPAVCDQTNDEEEIKYSYVSIRCVAGKSISEAAIALPAKDDHFLSKCNKNGVVEFVGEDGITNIIQSLSQDELLLLLNQCKQLSNVFSMLLLSLLHYYDILQRVDIVMFLQMKLSQNMEWIILAHH